MLVSPDRSTVLVVDQLPLRSLGLATVLDHLSRAEKLRLASLTPDDAKRWIDSDAHCKMIIYNVGGASIADHRHLKRIRELRARAPEAMLVIVSDNDSRKEVLSALSVGAQGFLYSGMNTVLARQALSFILIGGSYFPAMVDPRRHRAAHLKGAADRSSLPADRCVAKGNGACEDAAGIGSINLNLTERQRSVLERLSLGDANKVIARRLGIKEGTVKVHVRQIMRKLGVGNRTQVAVLWANGSVSGRNARGGGQPQQLGH